MFLLEVDRFKARKRQAAQDNVAREEAARKDGKASASKVNMDGGSKFLLDNFAASIIRRHCLEESGTEICVSGVIRASLADSLKRFEDEDNHEQFPEDIFDKQAVSSMRTVMVDQFPRFMSGKVGARWRGAIEEAALPRQPCGWSLEGARAAF